MKWQSRICASTQKKPSWESQKSACCCRSPRIIFCKTYRKITFYVFFTFISSMPDDKRSRQSDVRVSAVFHLYRCIFFNHFPFFCIPVIDIYLYLYEHMLIPVQSAESIALSQPHPNLHSYIFITRKVEIYPSVLVLFWHV